MATLPRFKGKVIPKFPSNVYAQGPLTVSKSGLDYTFGFNPGLYSVDANPTANAQLIVYDTGSESSSRVAFQDLIDLSTIGTAQLGDNSVTFAKIQDIAQDTLIGRYSSGAGDPQTVAPGTGLSLSGGTLSVNLVTLLDAISSTQGSIIYRNGSSWVALGPGTSGQFLSSGGAGANPSWVSASGTGDVTGPASSVDNEVALFNGTTGKAIKRSSLTATVVKATSGVLSAATAGTDYVAPGTATAFTAQQYATLATLTDGANISWNVASGQKAKVTLGGNRTMNAVTNAVEGATYLLWVIQDGTGSRTLAWTTSGAGSFDFGTEATPVLTTTASRADLLAFEAITVGGTLKLRFAGIRKGFS